MKMAESQYSVAAYPGLATITPTVGQATTTDVANVTQYHKGAELPELTISLQQLETFPMVSSSLQRRQTYRPVPLTPLDLPLCYCDPWQNNAHRWNSASHNNYSQPFGVTRMLPV